MDLALAAQGHVSSYATATLQVVVMFARIIIAVELFTFTLPKRPLFAARVACASGIFAVGLALSTTLLMANPPAFSPVEGYLLQFAFFSAVLVVAVFVITWLRDASVWVALFCTTAGYTIQNLASGTSELLASVGASLGVDVTAPATYWAIIVIPVVVIYVACHRLVVRKIDSEGLLQVEDRRMLLMVVVVILAIIGFDLTIKSLTTGGLDLAYVVVLRLLHGLACVFTLAMEYDILYLRRLEEGKATAEWLLAERERQYHLSQENIEAINIRCHDIRQQIRALSAERDGGPSSAVDQQVLDDIAREVSVYDSTVKTGNQALDTILTEKKLVCDRQHVTLTCIADGEALSFMDPADLYALFGNALDSAIDAVTGIDEPNRRSISLVVRRALGNVSVHVEHYLGDGGAGGRVAGGRAAGGRASGDGTGTSGFGVKSIRAIALAYNGTFSTREQDGILSLDILIPLPE